MMWKYSSIGFDFWNKKIQLIISYYEKIITKLSIQFLSMFYKL